MRRAVECLAGLDIKIWRWIGRHDWKRRNVECLRRAGQTSQLEVHHHIERARHHRESDAPEVRNDMRWCFFSLCCRGRPIHNRSVLRMNYASWLLYGTAACQARMSNFGDQLPELPCIWATANGSLSAVANFMCERLGSVGALLTGFATTPPLLSSERSSSVKRHAVGSEICIQV